VRHVTSRHLDVKSNTTRKLLLAGSSCCVMPDAEHLRRGHAGYTGADHAGIRASCVWDFRISGWRYRRHSRPSTSTNDFAVICRSSVSLSPACNVYKPQKCSQSRIVKNTAYSRNERRTTVGIVIGYNVAHQVQGTYAGPSAWNVLPKTPDIADFGNLLATGFSSAFK